MNNNFGLAIVNGTISRIFEVDKHGEGGGFIVPSPGVKQRNWLPIIREPDVRIFKYKNMNFYVVWSSNKQELQELAQLLKAYPDVPLNRIFS